jgi:hypothetical protein
MNSLWKSLGRSSCPVVQRRDSRPLKAAKNQVSDGEVIKQKRKSKGGKKAEEDKVLMDTEAPAPKRSILPSSLPWVAGKAAAQPHLLKIKKKEDKPVPMIQKLREEMKGKMWSREEELSDFRNSILNLT